MEITVFAIHFVIDSDTVVMLILEEGNCILRLTEFDQDDILKKNILIICNFVNLIVIVRYVIAISS